MRYKQGSCSHQNLPQSVAAFKLISFSKFQYMVCHGFKSMLPIGELAALSTLYAIFQLLIHLMQAVMCKCVVVHETEVHNIFVASPGHD